jgi:aspartate dehydrogenase
VIGTALARYAQGELDDKIELAALFDTDKDKPKALMANANVRAAVTGSIKDTVERCDLVIEAASKDAVKEVLKETIRARKDAMVISVGGLIDNMDLLDLAAIGGRRVYCPSGAIAGLDGVKAASLKPAESVTLTTTKPPKGLKGAPYITEKAIDLDAIKGDTVIFEGSALDAVKGFPKNINVSAALSLAGIGPVTTRVKIICSPGSESNIHEIEFIGESGKILARTENRPCPTNPKTSYLAALAAMAALKGIVEGVRIGT